MLFHNLIIELRTDVAAAVDELFNAAYARQTHPQDLLLVDQHGFHCEVLASPYVIGPGEIGFGKSTFYEFLDWFRKSHVLDKAEWEEQVAHDVEMQKHERLTIQIEQSIYLRFWEADLLLKQYHQLASLASGEPYNWHLTIPSHSIAFAPRQQA